MSKFTDFYNKIDTSDDELFKESNEVVEELDEALKRVRVFRRSSSGSIVRKIRFKTSRPGYKIKRVGGRAKEIRISPKEKRNRMRGQRKGARNRRKSMRRANMRRKQTSKRIH